MIESREFYILYKLVVRELVEIIKFRVVYDVFVRGNFGVFSLNECLNFGFFF